MDGLYDFPNQLPLTTQPKAEENWAPNQAAIEVTKLDYCAHLG